MNRFILKHGKLVTFVILAILAWFIYRQFIIAKSPLFPFVTITAVIWIVGTFLFIYFWPAITCNAYKRTILQHGLGSGPTPINTMCAADVLSSAAVPKASLLDTGASDLLYFGAWLDLSRGALVLHVPDFAGRYYSIQFTNPADGVNFAYVGKRTTGTQAGKFLITGPGWQGSIPQGMKQISTPSRSVMVLGRALVDSDGDIEAVYALTKQVQVTAFSAKLKS